MGERVTFQQAQSGSETDPEPPSLSLEATRPALLLEIDTSAEALIAAWDNVFRARTGRGDQGEAADAVRKAADALQCLSDIYVEMGGSRDDLSDLAREQLWLEDARKGHGLGARSETSTRSLPARSVGRRVVHSAGWYPSHLYT